jgi:hypothetical protein
MFCFFSRLLLSFPLGKERRSAFQTKSAEKNNYKNSIHSPTNYYRFLLEKPYRLIDNRLKIALTGYQKYLRLRGAGILATAYGTILPIFLQREQENFRRKLFTTFPLIHEHSFSIQ